MENDRNAIKVRLMAIYKEAMECDDTLSLYSGRAGTCLFALLFSKYYKRGDIETKLGEDIQSIIDGYRKVSSPTLANGKAGINWLYVQMYKLDIIEENVLDEVCFEDANLSKISLDMLENGNYDFLHGSIGIAYYLLERNSNPVFFETYFHKLNNLFSERENGMVPNFDVLNNVVEQNKVNMGLAHGLASILKFCLQCYKNKVCKKNSYILAQKIICYFRMNQNENKEVSYFPNWILDNLKTNDVSRLGWCYGDLTIAFILYQCAMCFDDNDLKKFALEVFEHSMTRVNYEETFVRDAGICHGSAGIAHIYNKMWKYTGRQPFKIACDYWIDQTLKYATFDDTKSGFKKYAAPQQTYQPSSSLLEGSSGIGLVLLSYLEDNFDWDYCLMLN